jgi:hypothetical protein
MPDLYPQNESNDMENVYNIIMYSITFSKSKVTKNNITKYDFYAIYFLI